MESKPLRVRLQFGIYKIIDPFVRFLLKIGFTPNLVTIIGFLLNIGVATIFVVGAERTNRGDFSYVGWAGGLILFAGLFDMLDRYSELFMFLGICYYLISHHYFVSSLFAFIGLIGSMMVSYTRARAEGLGIQCKGGLMQRPERIVLVGTSALLCGILAPHIGNDFKWQVKGIPFHLFETMSIFTIPLTVLAILTNITAYHRVMEAKRALDKKDKMRS